MNMREEFEAAVKECGDEEKFAKNMQLSLACYAYFIHGVNAAQVQQESYKIAIYEKALQDIQNPIEAMQRDIPEGYRLDGMAAIRAADNPQTYKDIVSKALQEASLPPAPEVNHD